MSLHGEDKPPSRRIKRYWKVAVLANIKDDTKPKPEGVPPDAFADFDHIETIDMVRAALETDGHQTVFIQADADLPYALRDEKPDICFNIAEGLGGDAREAQVPALLEMLRIPYTGSRVLANGISLDKTLTKRIWRDRRLPVAPFQEFAIGDEPLRSDLEFPLFVKPAREGTGMGVDMNAIVNNEKELRERAQYIIDTYQQPALVETCGPLPGWCQLRSESRCGSCPSSGTCPREHPRAASCGWLPSPHNPMVHRWAAEYERRSIATSENRFQNRKAASPDFPQI